MHYQLGRWARAAQLLERSIVQATQAGDWHGLTLSLLSLIRLEIDRGELVAARRLWTRLPDALPERELLSAELLLLEGQPAAALPVLRGVLGRVGQTDSGLLQVEARLLVGRVCEALEQPELAQRSLQLALESALRLGMEGELARCLRHLVSLAAQQASRLGKLRRAHSWVEQLWAKTPRTLDRLERARARFALARWLWRTGSVGKARQHARKALAGFTQLGAALDRAACRHFLHGGVPPRRSRRPRRAAEL
jgi:tetratricopeptide (TPR) repeat protein